ncbi:ABC transporter ATP-binding protein [Streptosporangium sp. NPDC004631]
MIRRAGGARAAEETSDPLPSSLISLGRSLRMGYRSSPGLILIALVTTLAGAAPDALFALGLAALANAMAGGSHGEIFASAGLLALMAASNWLLGLVGDRANRRFADRASVHVESHIASLQAGVATLEHHERPDQLDRISVLRDHAPALSDLYQQLFDLFGAALRLLITLVLLWSVHPFLVLMAVFAMPTVLVSGRRAAAEKRVEEASASHSRLARHLFLLATSASGGKELRVAGTGGLVLDRRHAAWERGYHPLARTRWVSALWQSGALALFGAAFMTAVAYVATHGSGRAGAVLLVLSAGSRLSGYIGQTIGQMHFFRTIWLDCSRKLAWLEDYAKSREGAADLRAPLHLRRGIRLEGVSFRYPGTQRVVLDDISVELPAGSVVALVGENGAGKSTLVKLLCGLYTPTSGRLTADGVDLARVAPAAWRRRLTGAFQDFFAFEYRLQCSVGLGDLRREGDEKAVVASLEKAGAADLVASLPSGVRTQLGASWPGGVDLSHGQWQRVALARGFMREDPLLTVLDEPTSAVDVETEHALFERYAALARSGAEAGTGGVTLLVSHRFSTVRMADLIIVLDGSRLVEQGSHEELMAKDGHYAELYNIQAAAYHRGLV